MPFAAFGSGLRVKVLGVELSNSRFRPAAMRFLCLFVCSLVLSCCAPSLLEPASPGMSASDELRQASSLAINPDEVDFSASPSLVYVGEEVTFFANATSSTGADITFLIYFEYFTSAYTNNTDSPYYQTTVASPGNIVVPHTYARIGNLTGSLGTYFRVRLYVGDGENTVMKGISVYVIENTAPTIPLRLPEAIELDYGMEYTFSTTVKDVDNDTLTVTWDFGDGTDPVQNLTGPAASGVMCNQTHAWSMDVEPEQLGTYLTVWMNLTVEDGHDHLTTSATRVILYIPWNLSPERTFTASTSWADPNEVVEFTASASDYEGDAMTWTFVFSDSYEDYLVEVYHTESTDPETLVWVNTTHVFGEVGNYTVTLFLSDVEDVEDQVYPHNISAEVRITVAVKYPPNALLNISKYPSDAWLNETTGVCSVILSIEANDPDGDVITATWDFGDNSSSAVNISDGGRKTYLFAQNHNYTVAGYYTVSVTITDGVFEIHRATNITIRSNNSAPRFRTLSIEMSNGDFAQPNSTVNFTLILNDAERDPIEVFWNFGDGTPVQSFNLSDFDELGNVTMVISHAYLKTGTYNITIVFTDHMFDSAYHNSSRVAAIKVALPRVDEVIVWDWWDYVSLGLFVGLFAVLGVWAWRVQRLRKRLDQQGMTFDEYRTLKKEQQKGRGPG